MSRFGHLISRSRTIRSSKDIFTYSAAAAFYTIFSFPAITLIILTLTKQIIQNNELLNQLQSSLAYLTSPDIANGVIEVVKSYMSYSSSHIALIFAIIITIYIATEAIVTTDEAINHIRETSDKKHVSGWNYLLSHIKALVMISMTAILAIILFVVNVLIELAHNRSHIRIISEISQRSNELLIILAVLLLSYLCYSYLMQKKIAKRHMLIGSAIFAIIFLPLKRILKGYLSRGTAGNIYETTSSIIVFIIWIYFVAITFFSTVCITKAISEIRPKKDIRPKQQVSPTRIDKFSP